ncbi:hypothetical protein [Gordonia iterans]|uniref:hypothetical protein n=1 Tax=Gordonia iterans TaxID=1004901 RepID=UPI001F2DC253|nr:hypothetical protein [Gordonia iterans]
MTQLIRAGDDGGLLARLPVIGGPVRAAVDTVFALPRTALRAVLDEVFAYLAETDLTPVLLRAVDLDRVLASVDLQALLARVDLNQLLDDVDLNALLDGVDLNPVLARLDLNPVVAALDLQAVIETVDIDKVLEGVDVDAVLARTDLVGTAALVVDGIDLNNIVREASASVTTEMITDVRSGSERADDKVDQFVGRILRRKAAEQPRPGVTQ